MTTACRRSRRRCASSRACAFCSVLILSSREKLQHLPRTLVISNSMRRRAALLELSNAYVVPEMRLQVRCIIEFQALFRCYQVITGPQMFKELQSVVGDSSAFTMCLAVYVQVLPPLTLLCHKPKPLLLFSSTLAFWSTKTFSTSSSSTPRNPSPTPPSPSASGAKAACPFRRCFLFPAVVFNARVSPAAASISYPRSRRSNPTSYFRSSLSLPRCAR